MLPLPWFPGYFHVQQSNWVSNFTVTKEEAVCRSCLFLQTPGFLCIHHWVAPAATLDLCCVSDAYPQGRPMRASTSCQDTERRIWRLPCWSWLSCLHLSVRTGYMFCSAVLYWSISGWSSKLVLFSPWHSCCWDSDEGSSVQACVKRPFHRQCPKQTSLPASGPRQSLTVGRVTDVNPFK